MRSSVAGGDVPPFFGLLAGTLRGFTSLGSCSTLVFRNPVAFPGLSQSVLVSQPGAFAERLGSPAER